MLDPKLGDLTIIRIIKVRTGYRSKDIRRIVVSIVKDNTDLDSWFSAKPIIVGNLSNILAGTEINLRQDAFHSQIILFLNRHRILYISGGRKDFIGEYVDSEWQ